jgi:hypothetical protein
MHLSLEHILVLCIDESSMADELIQEETLTGKNLLNWFTLVLFKV